jgi:hypothetical protein
LDFSGSYAQMFGVCHAISGLLSNPPLANLLEQASLVKADGAAATTLRVGHPCHASPPGTLGEPASCRSVLYKIRLFGYSKGATIFRAVSAEKRDQVRLRSRLEH